MADILNIDVSLATGEAPLVSDSMRAAFLEWLSAGNAKKFSPSVCVACLDKISEYARHKKICTYSLWEITQHSVFKPIYLKVLDAKLLRITDRNTYKVFTVAGQLYLKFLKEKPWAKAAIKPTDTPQSELVVETDTSTEIEDAPSGSVESISLVAPLPDINPDDVVAWLMTQTNANGTLYLDNVVRTYMSALRNAPQKLILPEPASRNVFACHKVAEVDDLWRAFKESPNYVDVSRTPWHGQLSAGLAVYRRYLEHLENEGGTTTPAVEPIQPEPEEAVAVSETQSTDGLRRVDFNRPEQCAQTKPLTCFINGQAVVPSKLNWSQLLVAITERFIADGNPNLESLNRKPLYGSKVFFLPQKAEFGTCAEVSNGKWIYTNYNPQTIVTIIRNLCRYCEVSSDDIAITYEPKDNASVRTAQTYSQTTHAVPTASPKPALDLAITEQVTNVLIAHFSNGYRLNSPIEMMRFRSFAAEDLGGELTLSDEELKSYISACGTTYDSKVYVVSAEAKEQIKQLAEEYFADGAQAIFFAEFYAKNENWLFEASVVSEDMLVSLLRRLFPTLRFTQTYFGYTDSPVFATLESEILRVWGDDVLLTYEQLAKRLQYIPIDRIKHALGQNGDFIWNSLETFSHVSRIKITDEEREAIREAAKQGCNARGYASITELPFGEIEERNYGLSVTAVQNAIYHICLSDKFDKKGKIITRKGDTLDALTIMKDYCRNIDKCSLNDLLNFEKELTGEVHQIAVEAGYTVLVRIDKDTYLADRYVHFNADLIDDAIEVFVKGNYLPLKSFTTFGAFPDCGQTWNLFLLESYCRRFSKKFRFDTPSVNSRNAGAVIRKSYGMNYTEIMTDAVANAGIPLNDLAVEKFLYKNGYIGRSTTAKVGEIIDKAKTIRERRS